MGDIPSHAECIRILKDMGAPDILIEHSKAVAELAKEIAELIMDANIELVEAGALLHDLGRIKTQGIDHGIVGAEMAKELALPEEIQHIIENHIGGGITEEDAKKLGLPQKNYVPSTLEEKIVSHADNLIDGTVRRTVESYIRKLVDEDKLKVARRVISLHNRLSEAAGIDLDELVRKERNREREVNEEKEKEFS